MHRQAYINLIEQVGTTGATCTDEEVDCPMKGAAPTPLQLNTPASLFEWEKRCVQCVHQQVDVAIPVGSKYSLQSKFTLKRVVSVVYLY